MAFNGSGTFVRVHDWTTDKANTVAVTASRMDSEDDGFATGLTNTICRDGQSTTTARIPFAAGVSAMSGATTGVSFSNANDANTGLYFPSTDQWGLVAGGTATLTSTSTKLTMEVAVDFDGVVAPTSSDGAALGSTTQMWSDLFLASGAVINFDNGDATITHAANALKIAGCTVTFDTAPTPSASDAAALGTASVMWSDLFLASGAVINFNNGDITVTHSADTLTVAGGTLAASGNATVGGTLGVTGASTLASLSVTGAMIGRIPFAHYREQQNDGVNSSDALTASSFSTRTLNTEVTDEITISLASNQMTIPAGTYFCHARAPQNGGNAVTQTGKLRLRDVTNGTTLLLGGSVGGYGALTNASSGVIMPAELVVQGRFAVAGSVAVELQHWTGAANTNGGTAVTAGEAEVYSEVLLWKVV
jgi:hypothetical protein